LPGGTLDPTEIEKYVDPLVIPPAMPTTDVLERSGTEIDYYEIAVRQFQQQILPSGMPATTVWSYGSVNHSGTFNYPAFTIEAKHDRPVRVKWINDLKDPRSGVYQSHLLPIDPTLHWANPPGGIEGRDSRPPIHGVARAYRGPVPISVHLHGGHVPDWADGYPEAWFLPDASGIPAHFAKQGTHYASFKTAAEAALDCPDDPLGCWGPGYVVFQYDNVQDAATLWYHDHTLGMTRTNVYAGPAGFYLLRGGPADVVGGELPGPAPAPGDAAGTKYYEIPIAIQDRSFNADGSLFYPDSREFFDGFAGPYLPSKLKKVNGAERLASDISPMWNPEFFGNTMVVNGKTWPYLDVEARRYRFRFLNGSDSRFLILATNGAGEPAAVPFWQIGADGGYLPDGAARLDTLLLAPAERADVIMDFSNLPIGTELTLLNLGPDEPFGGGEPDGDFDVADPDTTGQVMRFKVVAAAVGGTSTPAGDLTFRPRPSLPRESHVRQVSLNELDSATVCLDASGEGVDCRDSTSVEPVGPLEAKLGTVMLDAHGMPMGMPMMWDHLISENPALGATEIWEIYNFTMDAHPIHLHEIMFQVVDREVFMDAEGAMVMDAEPRPPEVWETGFKDTVIAYPGEITRVKATFDRAGLYVWHCHILSHEDNEMMRPYRIGEGALEP
jgi:FtsP/CotA-like multicopper oxidase with cupredoxin domain